MSNDLWRKGALELAGLIASKEVSSREVVQAHLDRIDAVNPRLNAVARRLDESALVAADAADRAVASGAALGALHGVPVTVKGLDGIGSLIGVSVLSRMPCTRSTAASFHGCPTTAASASVKPVWRVRSMEKTSSEVWPVTSVRSGAAPLRRVNSLTLTCQPCGE